MLTVTEKIKGTIKPMHGVGQPPVRGMSFTMFHYLEEAGIPFARLHDMGQALGGRFVDIHCVFPDFDKDPYDPASYDFAFTDKLMEALEKYHVEPFFRLGVTIENYVQIKRYHIFPPKDNLQWARICEGIIRHYTEGWADGYKMKIRYWEIWNEPENQKDPEKNMMWTGTQQEFFDLYETAAKHLKKCFPSLKIGGYASCGFYKLYTGDDYNGVCPTKEDLQYYMDFFNDFLAFVKKTGTPLDFFSWHNYGGAEEIRQCAEYVDKRLKEEGFTETEQTINEWNPQYTARGTVHHAALIAAVLLSSQDTPLDSAMFYDAGFGVSEYRGMFNPFTAKPFPSYYAFMGFNELYKRGKQMIMENDVPGLYAVAAEDEKDGALMLAYTGAAPVPLALSWPGKKPVSCRMIGGETVWEEVPLPETIEPDTVLYVRFE